MPEGHSVHRITRQFQRNFVGHTVRLSSPQGRFVEGAAVLNGRTLTDARAIGKQMFLEFDHDLWLRIHLGLYGAWDFTGDLLLDATIASANGRMGQTNQRGTILDEAVLDTAGENSLHSIGAPRRTRVRMSEQEKELNHLETFPPEPIGQVRVRLLTDTVCADLRGPTACVVLNPAQTLVAMNRLGPDPELDSGPEAEERFTSVIRRKPTPIGRLLMDQAVVSGIGNVYRAEMLFRAGINPHTPGKVLSDEAVRALWQDWAHLLHIGVETGQMMTMDDLGRSDYVSAMKNRADRHWVYKREGLPCRVCGTHIVIEEMSARKLYWCPSCQA
ncbi:DNA glycosylase [Cryobacterium roopkundense]|uniref:DNA-(apurinic or apyrimidinic site) lyase n=1 Tax=Cryobacterium roopkundense TaxID=1001240 RepID=A0A099JI65_9MICO|nr:DNA-formamidopyrimidine glycosylase family protein [Cryobacterium roopkundense]KGJ77123.1 DNA glycosylase [Cryobacterium roopkundense]MBB5641508.1 endonuclease-8 [Cryobacterium roopkundense]